MFVVLTVVGKTLDYILELKLQMLNISAACTVGILKYVVRALGL
jgi:hypothetical protein